jgi:hypothetical protein
MVNPNIVHGKIPLDFPVVAPMASHFQALIDPTYPAQKTWKSFVGKQVPEVENLFKYL